MEAHKPILVSGSHRSGTTWIGRMLAEAPSLFYIHEPFSVTDPPGRGICNAQFKHWFTYITRENEDSFYKPIRNMIMLKYDLAGELKTCRSREGLREIRRQYTSFWRHRQQGTYVLLKDPMAFFSAGWLADRFDMNVVMVVRHPAAFVSSIKKLRWHHPFSHFLEQPVLMRDFLYPFEEQIRQYACKEQDLLDQAILLWKLIHHTMLQYQKAHPDWIFVRHEDISRDPVLEFRRLYNQLSLDLTPTAKGVIENFSSPRNPSETDAPVGSEEILMRHSASSIWTWRKRLSTPEIEKIRCDVEELSGAFYSAEEWE